MPRSVLGGTLLPKNDGAVRLAYGVLGKATFGAILYALVFLLGAIQPLWYQESASLPPLPPVAAAVTAVLSAGLLLLPVLILFLVSLGHYGLVHKAMVRLAPEARGSAWLAHRWFVAFWILIGMTVLVFSATIAATVLAAPEIVRLSVYLGFATLPSALLIALVLFLAYSVWAPLPYPRRILLQGLVWADLFFVCAAAAGTLTLTALEWREIEASGVITSAYSPWTTIPSDVFNLGTLVALYFAFRWVRRHPPLREQSVAAHSPFHRGEDTR
jgi:hypothetical protein